VKSDEQLPQICGKRLNFERTCKYCRKQVINEKLEENKSRFTRMIKKLMMVGLKKICARNPDKIG
jgi:hypothetical protein